MTDQELALQNSKVMSLRMNMFHGSEHSFKVFDPARSKTGLGLWLSGSFDMANLYATRWAEGVVLEFAVDLKRLAEYDIAYHRSTPFVAEQWKAHFQTLGFDGLHILNGGGSYVIAFCSESTAFVEQHRAVRPLA